MDENTFLIFHVCLLKCLHPSTTAFQSFKLHSSTSQLFQRCFSLLTGGNKNTEMFGVRPAFQSVRGCINAEQKIAPALKVQCSLHPWLVGSRFFGKFHMFLTATGNSLTEGEKSVKLTAVDSFLFCQSSDNDDCSFKFWLGMIVIPFYQKCIFLLQPVWNYVILKMSVLGKFFGESIISYAYNQLWK